MSFSMRLLDEASSGVAPNQMTQLDQQRTWESTEGAPLPLGVTWIEREKAFNFAIHSEHAESVTLLLFSASDLVNPVFTYRFGLRRGPAATPYF